ncbi:hypothetical protein CC78DRAFT_94716 [Lojkania enalia]|uniref:Uncharacterized protein n=1 Tax=Lojkania enalia TaxID=147567 RepID=A0A9P4KES0_9PLEO|nr:hypothetical protein CC78DRAFT_94716 [Didymosphaeria enalia]
MAASEASNGEASQLARSVATIKISAKLPRRQLTLIAITCCLNALLWTSLFTLITSLYLIASDPSDATNIPSEALTLTSSLVSIAYIFLHTIFSLKQRIWKHQRRHPSILKKTSYFAIRFAVTLCILWLLTSGWNMIIVARRPVCLPPRVGLQGWEAGATCVVGRLGIAMSMLALLASCTLFGMLAVVRRPFEAHLLKHGYQKPGNRRPTPVVSRRPSPSRSSSFTSEKYQGRVSASTHRSSPSNHSNADVETLDLNQSPPTSTIIAPSPVRSIGLGIFTSHAQPPPLPAAFIAPRSTSVDLPVNVFQPSTSYQHLPLPPRMPALITPSGFVPLSASAQYSASAWRAVHPPLPSPLGSAASRSHPHLPHTNQGPNFSYNRSRYSRSSVSLTRPSRLSTATPVGSIGWSSRSGSTGPGEEGQTSPASAIANNNVRPAANAIAYAILNGTTIPGTEGPQHRTASHIRRASAPDASTGGQNPARKAKGWKPKLRGQTDPSECLPIIIPRASSAELLSRFSPDSSPDNNEVNLKNEFERELDLRDLGSNFANALPFRKSRSVSPLRHSDILAGATNVFRASTLSRMSRNPSIPKQGENGPRIKAEARRTTLDELKNKPLPKIAAL